MSTSKKRKADDYKSSNRPSKKQKTLATEVVAPAPLYYNGPFYFAQQIQLGELPYIAQRKDHVIFVKKGYQQYLATLQKNENDNDKILPNLQKRYPSDYPDLLHCEIKSMQKKYCIFNNVEVEYVLRRVINLDLTFCSFTIVPIATYNAQTDSYEPVKLADFRLDYFDRYGVNSFMVLKSQFDCAMQYSKNCKPGDHVTVYFGDTNASGYYPGTVKEINRSNLWENIIVKW